MKRINLIWITGPIASGKDEVCKILRSKGYLIIDADKIGHKLLEKNKKTLLKTFGTKILTRNKIARKKLSEIVFSDKKLLKKLNQIIHPQLITEIKKIISSNQHKNIAINAALYKQLKSAAKKAMVISVISNKRIRIQRLLKKKSIDKKTILSIFKMQDNDKTYKKLSDYVIYNNSTIKQLRTRLLMILSKS